MSEGLRLTRTHWTMEYEIFFTIMTLQKFRSMRIKRATGEILKWSNAFGKWNQILWTQKLLANHQLLPWFMIQLPVHLKTNHMMFWAVEACHSTREQVFCNKETKNRSQLWKLNQSYSFADFVCCVFDILLWSWFFSKVDYFMIEFSDQSADLKYKTLAKKSTSKWYPHSVRRI